MTETFAPVAREEAPRVEATDPKASVVAVVKESLEVFSRLAERSYALSLIDSGNLSSAIAQHEAATRVAVVIERPLGAFLFDIFRVFIPQPENGYHRSDDVVRRRLLITQKPIVRRAKGIRESANHLQRQTVAGAAVPLAAATTLIVQALIIMFIAASRAEHLPRRAVGVVLAAPGLGGAAGSATGKWRQGAYRAPFQARRRLGGLPEVSR